MSRLTKIVALLLAVFVAVPLLAAERKGAEKKRETKGSSLPDQFRLPGEIKLTAEQQKKFDELVATYKPKLEALEKQRNSILTEEQRKAEGEARKAAQAAKKTRTETQKAMEDAMKLKPEQKTKLDAITTESRQLGTEIRAKVRELLTPEQREQSRKAEPKKRERAKK